MSDEFLRGRWLPAPALSPAEQPASRRRFLQHVASVGAVLAASPASSTIAAEPLPVLESARVLGKPVAADAYGAPARFEANVIRRQSPGLTRSNESSIAFAPLQNLFGIITPNGLHFERDHAGRPEIDPGLHRLAIHGLVAKPKIYRLDDVLRMPSVSRIHFIECGANSDRVQLACFDAYLHLVSLPDVT